jgi:hypothetical protein
MKKNEDDLKKNKKTTSKMNKNEDNLKKRKKKKDNLNWL